MIPKLNILYEDDEILVCVKPAGTPCQNDKSGAYDLCNLIRNHLFKTSDNKIPYVGIIHRLDRPVGGVMVYAKTPSSAAYLSKTVKLHSERPNDDSIVFDKKYTAVLCQVIENDKIQNNQVIEKEKIQLKYPVAGTLEDYIKKDAKNNQSVVTDSKDRQGQYCKLSYEIKDELLIPTSENSKLLLQKAEIALQTGRHHQIRIQCVHHLSGLWADSKYHPVFQNKNYDYRRSEADLTKWYEACHDHKCPKLSVRNVALFSHSLTFLHPVTKEKLTFETPPSGSVFALFE